MPRLAPLVAGASLVLSMPLAAQIGLSSGPASIALSATHVSSIGVMVPGTVTPNLSMSLVPGSTGRLVLASRWNVDPAEPVIVTLAAFVEGPGASSETAPAGAVSRGLQVPVAVGGLMPFLPANRERQTLGGEEPLLFTEAFAPLVGRGARTDDVQVRSRGSLTVVATTQ